MIRFILLALFSVLIYSCTHKAHAGPFAPPQKPDNFSNAPEHFAMFGMIPGIVTTIVLPEAKPLTQWAVCQIPGAIHEFTPSPGNYRSNRDLLVNSLGCALGVWAGHGYSLTLFEGRAPMVTYSWSLK